MAVTLIHNPRPEEKPKGSLTSTANAVKFPFKPNQYITLRLKLQAGFERLAQR
jgi:hypothetical protein